MGLCSVPRKSLKGGVKTVYVEIASVPPPVSSSLTGPLPEEMPRISDLHTLYLSSNQLRGAIPEFPPLLEGIDIGINQFVGSIPRCHCGRGFFWSETSKAGIRGPGREILAAHSPCEAAGVSRPPHHILCTLPPQCPPAFPLYVRDVPRLGGEKRHKHKLLGAGPPGKNPFLGPKSLC